MLNTLKTDPTKGNPSDITHKAEHHLIAAAFFFETNKQMTATAANEETPKSASPPGEMQVKQ